MPSTSPAQDLIDRRAQFVRGERLQEDRIERHLGGFFHYFGGAVPGDEHGRDVRTDLTRLLEDLEAGHAGHLVVDDEQVELLAAKMRERRLAVVRALHEISEPLQHVHAQDDDRTGIVCDQDLLAGFCRHGLTTASAWAQPKVRVSGSAGSAAPVPAWYMRLISARRDSGIAANTSAILGSSWVPATARISSRATSSGRAVR